MAKFVAALLPAMVRGGRQRGLFPTPEFAEAFTKLGDGEVVTVEVKLARNLDRLRFYWALVTLVHDNVENELHPTKEDLSDSIKIMVGCRTRIWIPPGVVLEDGTRTGATGIFGYRPGHINFATMEEKDFIDFVDRVVDLIVKWYMPTITGPQLLKKVEEMCGIKPWWHEQAAKRSAA